MKCKSSKAVPIQKTETTAKYPKHAKKPDLFPRKLSGLAHFAYFAVQKKSLGGDLRHVCAVDRCEARGYNSIWKRVEPK